jgi:hypothetical protein
MSISMPRSWKKAACPEVDLSSPRASAQAEGREARTLSMSKEAILAEAFFLGTGALRRPSSIAGLPAGTPRSKREFKSNAAEAEAARAMAAAAVGIRFLMDRR